MEIVQRKPLLGLKQLDRTATPDNRANRGTGLAEGIAPLTHRTPAETGDAHQSDQNHELPLYREIASRILDLVIDGSIKPGEKVPSLRVLAERMGVSMGTVKEAYWYLEGRRYLEARPGSGFYVRMRLPTELPVHGMTKDPLAMDPTEMSLCRIYGYFQDQGSQDPAISLSIAITDPEHWPVQTLSRCFQESMRDRPDSALSYTMTPGLFELRQRISVLGLGADTRVSADGIVITNGCHESLVLALMAVCQPGDLVAVESPCYFNLLSMLRSLRLNVLEIPSDPETGMHIETLKFAMENHAVRAVVTIANFANPSGSLMPDERKAELVALTSKRGVPLIEDDIYGEIYQTEGRPATCKSFDHEGNVLLCSSFSKTLSPGLRLGWIMPGKWQTEVERLKNMLNIGSSSLAQIAVARYLGEGHFDRHLKRMRSLVAANMKLMYDRVMATFPEGTKTRIPTGGLVLWVKLPEGSDSRKLYRDCVKDGIMMAPGYLFGNNDKYLNYIRLNAGIWNPAVERAVARVGELARECRG